MSKKPDDVDMDADDEEFVDELEGDEEERPYFPLNGLKAPHTSTYSVELLWGMMQANDIDLEPEYQRGFVWTEAKQIALIDSLMRNYYIPPIIFRVISGGAELQDKMICIDGKQRLTSIRRFIEGEIPHKDIGTGVRYWSPRIQLNNRKSMDRHLPDNVFSLFNRKQIVCIEYHELSEDQERDIFNRVQMGMPLSSAEKMAAILSERSRFVRELQKRVSAGWPSKVSMSNDRNRLFQSVGHIVYAVENFPKWTSPSNMQLEKWLREEQPMMNEEGLTEDIDIILQIARAHADVAFSVAIASKLAPIEFIYSTLLVHLYKKTLTHAQLAKAISDTRRAIRREHADIRSNSRVSAAFQTYITGELANRVNSQVYQTPNGAGGKRKRTIYVEDDDDDYEEEDNKTVDISEMIMTPSTTRKRRTTKGASSVNNTPNPSRNLFSPSSTLSDAPTLGKETGTPSARASPSSSGRRAGWGSSGLGSLMR
ncbi:hypothetical protein FRC19_000921 [Serendipita sp. 401]|nr:hypothetical protein FRC19_000921 [Serendipita sp. 401]